MTPRRVETTPFGHLTIAFDDSVLRPRPWTARQSELAVELASRSPEGSVLEIFSGAGQIGLLAASMMERHLVQVDLSERACAFARSNADAAGARVDIRCGSPEAVLDEDERFAVVIADPPWVPTDEIGEFPEDPPLAIDGGVDGLGLARHSIALIGHHLLDGGHAVVQVGPGAQAESLVDAAASDAGLECVAVERFDRGVLVGLRKNLG
ncbi:methyltransferase domain-containing protein [Mumia sp. zg.B53]|uniref:methyltransferase domain-containing protein n=1 Tax=unclassified Mumia TaxID=2621872 RepID=UPI001C6E0D9D|nr:MULTISPECIES: methyltransferase domain-containing protein [unclassified Mumia]MBW9205869.1 methyltransferase domain-containing protein [Mumia sp. zg.B17]MBW9208127.1 methyltransferase domain-containing protein [Mumia sp. zg.B21]MBW9216082.1 methyltransferase domain-containing protein [Mumia sp. zg.B53]